MPCNSTRSLDCISTLCPQFGITNCPSKKIACSRYLHRAKFPKQSPSVYFPLSSNSIFVPSPPADLALDFATGRLLSGRIRCIFIDEVAHVIVRHARVQVS